MSSEKSQVEREEEQLAFEKARFEYCATMYQKEIERRQTLDKKTQIYLSYITLFLGVFFLKLDFLKSLRDLIFQKNFPVLLIVVITVMTFYFAGALIASLVTSLLSIRLKAYRSAYPIKTNYDLFSQYSEYLDKQNSLSFFYVTAQSYAIAVKDNRKLDDKRTYWLKSTEYYLLFAIILFAGLLILWLIFFLQEC